ncbi:hypothetical protein C8R43DRAFT_1018633 [Mycena crocata]|nr:hypothetical protein C8R43DRAFT_1018619 [Mycena crocata]KAJ7140008.1 hypothetical protein C8R43DRAFT_1018633 [Mycena crocata]
MVCLPAFRNSAQNAFAPRSREREARKKKRKNQEESEEKPPLLKALQAQITRPRKKSKEKENARREKRRAEKKKNGGRMQHHSLRRAPRLPPLDDADVPARAAPAAGVVCGVCERTNVLACIYAKNKTGENEWTGGRQEGEERLLWPATSPISHHISSIPPHDIERRKKDNTNKSRPTHPAQPLHPRQAQSRTSS